MLGRFMGRGGAKRVWAATWKGMEVAAVYGSVAKETEIVKKLRGCLYVAQWLGEEDGAVLMELAPHGSVRDLCDDLDFKQRVLSLQHISKMKTQILQGLVELWGLGYIHGDVATRNVLVFSYEYEDANKTLVKLTDFGECMRVEDVSKDLDGLCAFLVEVSNN